MITPEPYRIVAKDALSSTVARFVVRAPLVAAKAKAGQFVMLRASDAGERVPVTLVDWDATVGTVTVIVQAVGKTTTEILTLPLGGEFLTLAGPLGVPVELKRWGTVVCVGGGVGIAEVLPIAKAFKDAGNRVVSVLGARTKDLLILEREMRGLSEEVLVTTDDGSHGKKGLVTDALSELHARGAAMDAAFVIGPIPMMRFVAELTRPWGLPTFASLNPIMVDATGMCGGCRVVVGGKSKFACVDGPMFDAHAVDFPLLQTRAAAYRAQEQEALERWNKTHTCKLDQH
ncbi:MAG: sulfide/dihydroorotate dehydrogenase-like FAD/NAD-binding protein [Elusimicrobiota bacterium]|jgi:NAD(P)H-flavin reductase